MRKLIFAIIPAVMLAVSCEKEIRFNGDYEGEKLVLFSLAEPGHPLSARVRKSSFFLSGQDENLWEMLPGVTVQARYGDKEISFERDEEGVYRSSFVPSEGDHIEISAFKDGFSPVRAETVVPHAPEVSVTMGEVRLNHNDVEIHFKLTFHDRAGERDRYKVAAYTKVYLDDMIYSDTKASGDGDRKAYYSQQSLMTKDVLLMDAEVDVLNLDVGDGYACLEYLEDSSFDGEDRTFDVWVETYVSDKALSLPDYGLDKYEWVFDILSLSEDQYSYLVSLENYRKYDNGLGAVFGEPVCIHNNVKGGIGCFGSASGISLSVKKSSSLAL